MTDDDNDNEKEELIQKSADAGDWDQVLRLYDELYPDYKFDSAPELDADFNLTQKANYMSDVGKIDEGLKILQTCLEMKLREQGEKGRGVLNLRQNIGGTLYQQSKLDAALEILNDVLEKQIETLGDTLEPYHVDIDETRYVIAIVLHEQGKLEEALPIYEKIYETNVIVNGAEVDLTAHIGFHITSLKLKMAAEASSGLDIAAILEIVGYGPSVFSIKEYGEDGEGKDTVLHRAVRTNDEKVIQVVLENLVANSEGDEEKLKEFLNFENSEVQTPLTLAVKSGCENGVRFLLENGIVHGLDVNKVTRFDKTALLQASYRVDDTIKNLLLEYNATMPPASN